MQIHFAPVSPDDLAEISHLRPEGWPDIVPDFEFYLRSEICHPVKAVLDSKIVGLGASIIFKNTAWIAHIIVDAGYRNMGIGAGVVKRLLDDLDKRQITTCSLIATELGKPVYSKLGFRNVTEYVFLKREKPWKSYPVSGHIVPFSEEYRAGIYELDKKVSGEDREELLSGFIENSILYIESGKVAGYYLPGLKEGLIFAGRDDAAIELMKIKYAKDDIAFFPSENKAAIEFLAANGFSVFDKKGTRMIYGNDLGWKPEMIYSRIGGNLG